MTAPPLRGAPTPSRAVLWLALIILLGLGLRLAGLIWGQAYCHFGQGDGIEAYSFAVDFERGIPRAVYLGQPNFNSHSKLPGPLWTLFCYVCWRGWGSVEGIVIGTILLNTAAIGFTYLLTQRTIGQAAALWAALLAATLPWVVYYSVGIYNPEVMSFLSALLFLSLWRATQVDRSRSIFWVPVLLLVMPQVHMSGLMLIPAVLVVMLLSPVRLNLKWLLGGVMTGLALYLPYARGELATGWQNTRGMFEGGASSSWNALKALSAPLSFLTNWAPEWGRKAGDYAELGRVWFGSFGLLLAVNLLSALVAGFLVVGALMEVRKAMRGFWAAPRQAYARTPGVLFLTILFVVPLIFSVLSRKAFHTRYGVVLLPVMLPLAALAIVRWLTAPRIAPVFRMALVATCVANVWLVLSMYYQQGREITSGPHFIPSFRKLETIYQFLKARAPVNSLVQVDAADFLHDLAVPEHVRHDAVLLSAYVWVREKERGVNLNSARCAPYRLYREAQVKPEDASLVYHGNGIALVSSPAAP